MGISFQARLLRRADSQLTTSLGTAPIAATNGIEDRHKKGSVLKKENLKFDLL
jgi:hypothetical protein